MVNGVSALTQQMRTMMQRALGRRKKRRQEMARARRRRTRWRLDWLAEAMGWWRICPKQSAQRWALSQEMLVTLEAQSQCLRRCAHLPCLSSVYHKSCKGHEGKRGAYAAEDEEYMQENASISPFPSWVRAEKWRRSSLCNVEQCRSLLTPHHSYQSATFTSCTFPGHFNESSRSHSYRSVCFVPTMVKRKRCETPSISLPPELLEVVAEYACHRSSEGCGLSSIDFKTALSVTLVSKRFNRISNRLLYAHVRLTKPSDLLLYARTVSMRPSLAKHTKTLWMGPDENHMEARSQWPLNKDLTAMRSSISEPSQLPAGVHPGTFWSFAAGEPVAEDWLAETARLVIREASRRVGHTKHGRGVSLRRGGFLSYDGKQLDTHEGTLRVYWVQQILDSFLRDVRNRESSCSAPGRLVRTSHTAIRDASTQQSIPVGRSGAPSQSPPREYVSASPLRLHDAFDRFDHRMLYARSGKRPERPTYDPSLTDRRPGWSVEEWRLIKRAMVFEEEDIDFALYEHIDEYGMSMSDLSEDSRSEISGELEFRRPRIGHSERNILYIATNYHGDCSKDLTKTICGEVDSGWPSLGALIIFSRVILGLSPNLVCLALTSYLQQAVTGDRHGQTFNRLQLLALGPPGQQFDSPLRLGHRGLSTVKRLKMWGEYSTGQHRGGV